jgi:hypothetical protein
MQIGRTTCVVVSDEKGGHGRRWQGVDGSPAARRGSAKREEDVGEVEEAACSSLVSRGGLLRRRAPCTGGGVDLAIGRRYGVMWRG